MNKYTLVKHSGNKLVSITGSVVVIDACYVLADSDWQEICNAMAEHDTVAGEIDVGCGYKLYITSTSLGDGLYSAEHVGTDEHGEVPVDSGTIAVMSLETLDHLVPGITQESIQKQGTLFHNFDGQFYFSGDGDIYGDICVITTPDEDEDDDNGH